MNVCSCVIKTNVLKLIVSSLLFVLLDASNIRSDGSDSYRCNHPVSGLLIQTTTSLKVVDCSHYFNAVYKCNRTQCCFLQFELLQTLFIVDNR